MVTSREAPAGLTPQPGPRALEIALEALAAVGQRIRHAGIASIEPRGDGNVVGIDVDVAVDPGARGTALSERRTVYVDDGSEPAGLWVHPDDPHLPALAAAAFPHSLGVLLARTGVPGAVERVDILAYRPTRRAVLRAITGAGTFYAKVVRPHHVDAIVTRHRVLRGAGVPVPEVLGWSPAGLVVIEPAAGTPLVDLVDGVDPDALVTELDVLRSRLAAVRGLAAPARPSVAARASWYAARLGERMPRLEAELADLVEFAAPADTNPGRHTTVHGDLHAGQLFLDDDARTVAGLIDVDTAGTGDAGVDSGAFVAHALASAAMNDRLGSAGARRASAFRELADAAERAWLRHPAGPRPDAGLTARRHAVGHLLAHAMHSAVSRSDAEGTVRLLDRARDIADAEVPG